MASCVVIGGLPTTSSLRYEGTIHIHAARTGSLAASGAGQGGWGLDTFLNIIDCLLSGFLISTSRARGWMGSV